MTKVVNLYKDPYDVYIGRSGKGKDGYFGNSHPIGFCEICDCRHNRDSSISSFWVHFQYRIKNDLEFKKRVLELKDKTLGCFCKPKKCHGDVYVEYLDNL